MAKPDCSELAKTITELALAIGSQPGKGNIDAITAEMQTRLPEITREMVVDSINEATAGQSRTVDEAKQQAAAIKREARRDKALRDAIAKLEAALQSTERAETTASPTKEPPPAIQELQKKRDRLKAFVDAAKSPKELSVLAQSLAREFVSRGITERGALLNAVHAELAQAYPNITRRQTMDAISGYGDFKPLKKGEIEEKLRDLKGQLQQIAKLEDMAAGHAPAKTGIERRTPSNEERALIKKVEAAKKEGGFVVTDPEKQLKSALDSIKTRLRNQITDLTKQIQTREKIVAEKRLPPTDAEAESLRKQRDALKEQFREVFGVPGRSQEQRIEAAKRAIEKSIADLTKRLSDADFSRRTAETVTTPELTALRARRDALAKQYKLADPDPPALRSARVRLGELEARLREGLGEPDAKPRPAGDPRTAAIRSQIAAVRAALRNSEPAMQKRLEKSIAGLETKLDSIIDGSYIAPVKPTPTQTQKIERLAFERDRLRKQINQKINALKPRRVFERVAEPFNAARAILTSYDFSGLLRQGGWIVVGHPVRSAKAIGPMFRAFASEQAQDRIWNEIQSRPNAPLYARSKLYLAPPDSSQGLTKQEEAYMSRWAEKVPLVAASQRAYSTVLNVLRADSFDAMSLTLARDAQPTQAESDAIANYVNVASGRGTLGAAEGFAFQLNTIFFAPKYVASRFQLLFGQPLYHGTSRTRTLIAKEYARYLMGMGLVYALSQAMWGDEDDFSIEMDPRSSNFGRLRFGNARLDPLSGLAQTATLSSRILTGTTKTGRGEVRSIRGENVKFGQEDSAEVAWRFIRYKFSPITSFGFNVASGKDPVGQPTGVGREVLSLVTPLAGREVYEALQDQGLERGTAMGLAVIFGVGLSVYGDEQRKPSRRSHPSRPTSTRPKRPSAPAAPSE